MPVKRISKKRKQSWLIVGSIVGLLLVCGGVFIFARARHTSQLNTTQSGSNNSTGSGNSSSGENLPRQSQNTPPASGQGSSGAASAPSKPALNKSSGNGPDHTVPAGIMMNFICNSDAGTTCTVILTDQGNANHVINLGAKAMTSSRGQPPFASWDWQSVGGNWNIIARATNSAGQSSQSDAQPLKVQ